MRSLISFVLIVLCAIPSFSQNLGAIMKGTGGVVSFNRISLVIPADWKYSKNPRERPGTDQIQLYSDDRNRTLLITITKDRPEVDFIEAEHSGRFEMLRRALTFPGFEKCVVVGSAQKENIWGRSGIFTRFDLFKDENKNENEIMMRLYNYGEQLTATSEVLFITAYIIGEENNDTNEIVKSLKFGDK